MADQIYAPGPLATPAKYVVPGSSEIVPLAVQAVLDGTNASGDFVPTLIFRSQAGHVIARVPTSTTVVAGGSAEVSWFPGVKAAAPTGTAYAVSYATGWRDDGRGDANFPVANGVTKSVPFLHVATSNAANMAWHTIGNPNDTLFLNALGLYSIAFTGSMTVGETWQLAAVVNTFDDLQHAGFPTGSVAGAHNPPHGIGTHRDDTWVLTTSTTSVRFWVENFTGFDRITDAYYVAVTYFGLPA